MAVEKQKLQARASGYQTPNAARADAIRAVASGGDGRPVASVGLSSQQFSARLRGPSQVGPSPVVDPQKSTVDLPAAATPDPASTGVSAPVSLASSTETIDLPASMSPEWADSAVPSGQTVDLPASTSPPSEAQRASAAGMQTVDLPFSMSPPSEEQRAVSMETVDLPASMSPPSEVQRNQAPGLDTVDLPSSMSPPSEDQRNQAPALSTVDLPASMSPPSQAQRGQAPGLETVDVPAEMTPPLVDIGRKVDQRADEIRSSGRLANAAPMSAKVHAQSARCSYACNESAGCINLAWSRVGRTSLQSSSMCPEPLKGLPAARDSSMPTALHT